MRGRKLKVISDFDDISVQNPHGFAYQASTALLFCRGKAVVNRFIIVIRIRRIIAISRIGLQVVLGKIAVTVAVIVAIAWLVDIAEVSQFPPVRQVVCVDIRIRGHIIIVTNGRTESAAGFHPKTGLKVERLTAEGLVAG